ncbi:MAG: hypothetical protein M3258_08055, partial [Thermoproteota archaeon]|nr:hypothetical protein [Thermoproteota archaeon]
HELQRKGNSRKSLRSKERNLLTNAVYVIVHFQTGQNLSVTKTHAQGTAVDLSIFFIALFKMHWSFDNDTSRI